MDADIDVSDLTEEQLEKALKDSESGKEVVIEPAENPNPEDVTPEPQEPTPEPEEPEAIPGEPTAKKVEDALVKKPKVDKKPDALEGVTRDLIAERGRRRDAEAKASSLEKRLEKVESQLSNPQVPDDVLEDDDVTPFKIVKELKNETDAIKQAVDTLKTQAEETQIAKQQSYVKQCEEDVKAKYSAETVGEEYSYSTILADVVIPMMESNPKVALLIRESDNPALTAYKLGLSSLVDPERLVNEAPETPEVPEVPATPKPKVAPKVNTAPKTLGSIPGGGGANGDISTDNITPEMISEMGDEDLNKLLKKLS